MAFNPVTTHSNPVLLICNFSCAVLGWRPENICCVYELSLELSPCWDTTAWHRWGATEAMAKPSIISHFPPSWLVHTWGASALLWSAKGCEAPGHHGVQRGVICSHNLSISADAWVFCEGSAPFESSSRTGCCWLTKFCASYCSPVFCSSFDVYCTICNVAIALRETSENVIPWHFEASYFGHFGVKSVQMFECNVEDILTSPNLLHCSEARIA